MINRKILHDDGKGWLNNLDYDIELETTHYLIFSEASDKENIVNAKMMIDRPPLVAIGDLKEEVK